MKAVCCCLLAVMILSSGSASAQDITQTWFLNSFSTIKQCSPIQVNVVPSADDTYKVDFIGDASVVKNLNAYVKDGELNIENTGIFKSSNPVGIRVSMPASALTTVYAQGPGSMTMLPGLSAEVMTVQTQQYSGPLTVGVNNTAAKVAITHASTAPLNVSGLVGSVQFSSSEKTGPVVLNAVGSSANVNVQGGANTVYIGGPSDLKITGTSSNPALIQYSDGTCDLFQGASCTKVPAIPVQQVTEQIFTGASSGQICSCGGGCVTPTPPPSSVGSQCISTGPNNCKGCCERKLLQGDMSSDSSCFTFECSPFVAPPSSPKPGSECASTGPACRECCWNKVLSGQYSSDPSCQTLQCSPFLPTPPPPPPPRPSPTPRPPSPAPRPPSPTGQSCITTSNCRSCCQSKLNKGTMYTDSVCYTNVRCIPSVNPPPAPTPIPPPTPILGNSCLTTTNCRQCCQAKEDSGTAGSDRGCSNPDLYPQCNTNLLGG